MNKHNIINIVLSAVILLLAVFIVFQVDKNKAEVTKIEYLIQSIQEDLDNQRSSRYSSRYSSQNSYVCFESEKFANPLCMLEEDVLILNYSESIELTFELLSVQEYNIREYQRFLND